MKCIKKLIILSLILSIFGCNKKKDASEYFPEYKLITMYSEKIKPETGLILCGYGVNHCLPDNYEYINGLASFSASYRFPMTREDSVSLEEARNLTISVAEGFLKEINSNSEIRDSLDVYPLGSDRIKISILFEDQNRVELGQGVASVYLARGKIKYDRYEIREYTGHYPAKGKNYTIHEESYAEALKIVKDQEALKLL